MGAGEDLPGTELLKGRRMPIKLQDCNLVVVGSNPTRSMAMSRSGSSGVEHAVLSLLSPPLKNTPPLGMRAALHW